mgnify:FL=1
MKSFNEYLTESKKTYKFKIKAAGELPEGFEDKMERALNKYEVVKFSKGSTTPIDKTPLDFPQIQNCEVTHFEAEVSYPVTSHILQEYLSCETDCAKGHLRVSGENDPIDELQKDEPEKPYETMLTKEDMGGESAQESVGQNRVMDLLRELDKVKKEKELDPTKGIASEK